MGASVAQRVYDSCMYDSPGFDFGMGKLFFCYSKPPPGQEPTQSPNSMDTVGSFPVRKASGLRMCGGIHSRPIYAFMACTGPTAYWLFGYLFPLQTFYSVGVKEFHLDCSGICQGTLLALIRETEEEL